MGIGLSLSAICFAQTGFINSDSAAPANMERLANFQLAAKVSIGVAAPKFYDSAGKVFFEAHSQELDDRILKEITSNSDKWIEVKGPNKTYVRLDHVGKVEFTGPQNPVRVTLIHANTAETVANAEAVAKLRKALGLP